MPSNLRGSQRQALIGVIDPEAVNGGSEDTGWLAIERYMKMEGIFSVGVNATSAIVIVEQATDSGGTGAKPITGKVPVINSGDNDEQVLVDIDQQDLDHDNGFSFVRFKITTVGIALISGIVLGLDTTYGPADQYNVASVDQIV